MITTPAIILQPDEKVQVQKKKKLSLCTQASKLNKSRQEENVDGAEVGPRRRRSHVVVSAKAEARKHRRSGTSKTSMPSNVSRVCPRRILSSLACRSTVPVSISRGSSIIIVHRLASQSSPSKIQSIAPRLLSSLCASPYRITYTFSRTSLLSGGGGARS